MLHCTVEGESQAPPLTPADGENWIVAAAPTGEWQDREGQIACRQSGNWLFVPPFDGMRVFDRSTGQFLLRSGGWQAPSEPAPPTGGGTVDSEARNAIAELIAALKEAGVFPAT